MSIVYKRRDNKIYRTHREIVTATNMRAINTNFMKIMWITSVSKPHSTNGGNAFTTTIHTYSSCETIHITFAYIGICISIRCNPFQSIVKYIFYQFSPLQHLVLFLDL